MATEATHPEGTSPGAPDTAATTAADAAPPTGRDVAESAMRAIVEIDAAIAGLQAMRAQLLAGVGHVAIDDAIAERLDPGVGVRDVAAELAALQRRSDRTIEAELNESMRDLERWPATVRAWGAARIHRGHVRVITEIGAPLTDPAARAAFETALLAHAAVTTPGRLRAIARRQLDQHLREPLAARHQAARAERAVTVTDLDDGMAMLRAIVPAVLAHGIHDRLTRIARAAPADDPRSYDQRRADTLADLLLTGDPTGDPLAGIHATITIVMPAPVLHDHEQGAGFGTGATGSGPSPGGRAAVARLAGGTPVDPDTARTLAARTRAWTRLFTDPRGQVTAVDTYTPSKQLQRLLRARDQHCRWPGCTTTATRCDIDHTIPWADGGRTRHDNLAHLCRRHHTLKGAQLSRARRWKVEHTTPGVLTFTSPMGHTYTDQPTPMPAFHDDQPDPAVDAEPAWGSAASTDAPF